MKQKDSSIRSKSGFTLIEALVALVIFGIISVVLSAALTGSLDAQAHLQQRQEQSSEVRAVFGNLTQDIQSAVGSLNNPDSVFITGASQSSSSSSTGAVSNSSSLLTLSTMTQTLINPDISMDGANSNGPNPITQPQSASSYVRYDLNSGTGALTRSTINVPNLQQLAQASPGQETTLAEHVESLQLQFWDPKTQQWTSGWDYEQSVVSQSIQSAAASSSSASGSSSASSSTPPTGNVVLPSAVQVTLVLRNRSGGSDTYTTSIPVVGGLAPAQPQNTAPAPSSSTTGS